MTSLPGSPACRQLAVIALSTTTLCEPLLPLLNASLSIALTSSGLLMYGIFKQKVNWKHYNFDLTSSLGSPNNHFVLKNKAILLSFITHQNFRLDFAVFDTLLSPELS